MYGLRWQSRTRIATKVNGEMRHQIEEPSDGRTADSSGEAEELGTLLIRKAILKEVSEAVN